MSENNTALYTPEEARQILRLSRNGIYEAIARGEVPHIRIGRKILVPRLQLERMINGAAPAAA
ncbi:excisionase family DNA binding protein [Constrictibacter sp. MBR-5]|uniref:helix-turn-helix domain-containing protein n=1 Tax=Constrictibacter sp. MBR-5 TaxID=3156467 RepID=UPI0033969909